VKKLWINEDGYQSIKQEFVNFTSSFFLCQVINKEISRKMSSKFLVPKIQKDDSGSESSNSDFIRPMPGRKRKLDHLSFDEKVQRKKLKNRVAAQTSRDRKKKQMEEMQDTIELQSKRILIWSGDAISSPVNVIKFLLNTRNSTKITKSWKRKPIANRKREITFQRSTDTHARLSRTQVVTAVLAHFPLNLKDLLNPKNLCWR